MKQQQLFTGILPALITPIDDNGRLLKPAVHELVRRCLTAGCTGFYVGGATGEGFILGDDVRREMAETVMDAASGRGHVIVHVGAPAMTSALDLARHAREIGAAAVSSVPPLIYAYGPDEVVQYYQALADEAAPLIIYNSPLVSGLTGAVYARLFQHPGIVGVKWTGTNCFDMQQAALASGRALSVFNGSDETLLCGLIMGATGGIGSNYNIMPGLFVRIYQRFMARDLEGAMAAQHQANALIKVVLAHGIINSAKELARMSGIDAGQCALPLKRFSEEERTQFHREIQAIGYDESWWLP